MNKLKDIVEFNAGDNKKRRICKKCHNESFETTLLGTATNGNMIFEAKCLLGCTNFLYLITPNKKYIRTGELNE